MERAYKDGDYYTIHHVCLFTGLTDRTVRNYISMGILKGEKMNGIWHFTSEQVDAFICHPSVRPSLLAKRNSYVYDFMMNPAKDSHRCCMILDLPGEDMEKVSAHFCCVISTEDYHNIDFSLMDIRVCPG